MKTLLFILLLLGVASCRHLATSFVASRVFVGTPAKLDPRFVKDCMTTNPVTLKATDTVDEAIQKLLHLGFNGAPVVDSNSQLVGVISAFDFLQKENGGALLPMQGSKDEMTTVVMMARKICATTVGDLMTPLVQSIGPEMRMREAAALMTKEKWHRLCVVNEEGTLIGILSTSDVMKDVLTTVRQALPESAANEENGKLSP
jgi:CBS domain-containing protein